MGYGRERGRGRETPLAITPVGSCEPVISHGILYTISSYSKLFVYSYVYFQKLTLHVSILSVRMHGS